MCEEIVLSLDGQRLGFPKLAIRIEGFEAMIRDESLEGGPARPGFEQP